MNEGLPQTVRYSDRLSGYGPAYKSLAFNIAGGWLGAIDDVYRRYIVIRRDEIRVVVHGLGHVFLFEHLHTGGGMTAFGLCAFGDHLCFNSSVCFDEEDLAAIARINGGLSTVAPLSERQDLINGYYYVKTVFRYLYDFVLGRNKQK